MGSPRPRHGEIARGRRPVAHGDDAEAPLGPGARRTRGRTATDPSRASRPRSQLSPRELELLAVTAYWCEGTKSKPYARREQVTFINSDPGLILLFLAWLDQIEFPAEHRHFSLSIHESADVETATAWWADVVGLSADAFGKAVLKKHNPKTVRLNVGGSYVGCLVIRLRQCRTLYQQIEGVWQGIMGGLPPGGRDDHSRVV